MIASHWKDKSVFITGHTGFKGSWLTKILQLGGARVTGYSLAPSTDPNLFEALNIENKITHIIGDVRDLSKLKGAIKACQPQAVFHLAAEPIVRNGYLHPIQTFQTNLMGTIHLLEAVRLDGVQSVVVVTTDKVYANDHQGKSFCETDPLGPGEIYGGTKACAELAAKAFRESYFGGKVIATARAGNVIGGGDWAPNRLVPDLIRALSTGTAVEIRNPEHVRPWQHVFDCVQGYIQLSERISENRPSPLTTVNFGPPLSECVSVSVFVNQFIKHWGSSNGMNIAQSVKFPEASVLQLSSEVAKTQLNWRPQFNLTQSIHETVRWYKEFQNPRSSIDALSTHMINEYFFHSSKARSKAA